MARWVAILAAPGLALSLAIHLTALLGWIPGGVALFNTLSFGLIPVVAGAIYLALGPIGSIRVHWRDPLAYPRAVTREAPRWVRRLALAAIVYAAFNYALSSVAPGHPTPEALALAPTWRFFSGTWIAFHAVALTIALAAAARGASPV